MSLLRPVTYNLSLGSVSIYRVKNISDELDLGDKFAKHVHPKRTKFDLAFIDYDGDFSEMLNSEVPESKRLKANTGLVKVLSFKQDGLRIDRYLDEVKEIANMPINQIRDMDLDEKYRVNLKEVCKLLHDEFDWYRVDATLVPLRGGGIIAGSLPRRPFNMIPLESKRVPLDPQSSMGFGLGTPETKKCSKNLLFDRVQKGLRDIDGKNIRVIEVAVATGLTTISYLLYLADSSIRPRHIEIVAPVACQQGIDLVLKTANDLGMNVTFVVGKLYYRVGNFWKYGEDTVLDEDGKYIIGDASEILSKFLNVDLAISDLVDGE